MTGLVRAELLRLTSRRLFRLLAVAAIVAIIASAVIAFVQSSDDPNAGLPAARRDATMCEAERDRFAREAGPEAIKGFDCPTVDELRVEYDKRFVYADTMPTATRGVAVALFVLAMVVAASFVGADWGTGSTTTLLTWEPRRGRVLAAKVIVAASTLAVAAAVLLALLDVVFLPVGMLRGTTEGLDGSTWWTLAGAWLRGAGLVAFGAIVASGVATIARNTVAVVGLAFAYGIILDPILGAIRQGRLRPWLLQHNVPRLLGFPDVPQPNPSPGEIFVQQMPTLGPLRPAVLLSIYAAAIIAVAYAVMRSRDVT